jgi:hypothetical protein
MLDIIQILQYSFVYIRCVIQRKYFGERNGKAYSSQK